MNIYILTINSVAATPDTCFSSYVPQRYPQRVEYYLSKTGAELRRDEIYDGVQKLIGFVQNVEVSIKEVEVKP